MHKSTNKEHTESLRYSNKYDDDVKNDVIRYVYDCLQRLAKANHCLHVCLEATLHNKELKSTLHWDSWHIWANDVTPSAVLKVQAAIVEARRRPTKSIPKPLPPLPELPRISRLSNYQTSCDNSKSTGSSPLSPPAPPMSAGYNSHRSALSTSSSSSSIIPSSFYCIYNNSSNMTAASIVGSGASSSGSGSVGGNGNSPANGDNPSTPSTNHRATPPQTPPVSHHKRSFIFSSFSRNSDRKCPTTPPPTRRHQANLYSNDEPEQAEFPLITKSKSHEEHLSNRIDSNRGEPIEPLILPLNNSCVMCNSVMKFVKKCNLLGWAVGLSSKSKSNSNKQHNSLDNLPHGSHRRRLATEPGSIGSTSPTLASSNCSSPVPESPDKYAHYKANMSDIFLDMIPRSPRSTYTMLHSIHHRFTSTVKLSPKYICNVCDKNVWLGYKCRDCKFYCHWDCMLKAPPSCGLPPELFNLFKKNMDKRHMEANTPKAESPYTSYKNLSSASFSYRARSQLSNYPTTSSQCSSIPSSPALFNQHSNSSSAALSPTTCKNNSQFQFPPDINITSSSQTISSEDDTGISSDSNGIGDDDAQSNCTTIHEEEETQKSNSVVDSEKSSNSLVTSGSSDDSARTITGRLNSQDSQTSEADQNDRAWMRHNSLISREWDIPYEDILVYNEIGEGRFGTVYRGNWHGDVAIKKLKAQNNNDDDRKGGGITRHDNLVLFMGVCTQRPHLAIVTGLCKGVTLHTHIHIRHDRFNLNRIIRIAEQICQGMSYLHGRSIVHKDLKTKNIFYENGRVTITDFGLSSVAKLCDTNRCDRLTVPKGWLCYLAPEIIRTLSINSSESDDLPFSPGTDVYAYGTVLYELLFGCWPFSGQPSEVIIWQVGKGIKQSINNFQVPKEVKDILSICWSFDHDDRPDFIKTLPELLQKMPKKRLQRSPSHPAHLQHTPEQKF
ncbi:3-dehydrosphinganine reductase [Blomia tropicalis]|nr:3-dehydrosphinganine reductase [Blomia tropicalis]